MLDSARDHSFCHDELDNRRTLILARPLIATRPDKFLIIAKASSHYAELRATECPMRAFAPTLGKNIFQANKIGSRQLSSNRIFLDGRNIQDIFLSSIMIIGYICNLFAERCIRFHAGFFRLNIISRGLVLLLSIEKLFQLSIFSLRRIDTHFKMTRRKMFKHIPQRSVDKRN